MKSLSKEKDKNYSDVDNLMDTLKVGDFLLIYPHGDSTIWGRLKQVLLFQDTWVIELDKDIAEIRITIREKNGQKSLEYLKTRKFLISLDNVRHLFVLEEESAKRLLEIDEAGKEIEEFLPSDKEIYQ